MNIAAYYIIFNLLAFAAFAGRAARRGGHDSE